MSDYSDAILKAGPVAYWRLGVDASALVGGHDGVATAGVAFAQPGALVLDDDKAASFDGGAGHQINLGTIAAGDPLQLAGGPFMMAAWFWQSVTAGGYGRIIDKSTAAGGVGGYSCWANPTTRRLAMQIDGNWFETAAAAYSFGAWHMAAFVVGVSTDRIYVNGVAVSASFYTGSHRLAQDVSAPAAIGNWNHATGREWKGYLDEVALFDRALTAAEIAHLYKLGAGTRSYDAATSGGPLRHLPMIEQLNGIRVFQ